MDPYEATQIVLSRIQTLDPENASKIMGSILIQDNGEKEMIRLAFCPDALLLSYINQVKARLTNPPPNTPPIPIRPRIMVPRTPSLRFYGGEFSQFDDPLVDHNSNNNSIMSPGGMSDSLVPPYGEEVNGVSLSPHGFHRRSFSVNDAAFLANNDDGVGGLGWKPCMYFARGFCKNGSGCKFLHSDGVEGVADVVGSPGNNGGAGGSGFDESMRLRALQQQQHRLALMASGVQNHHPPFGYNRCMDFLEEFPRSDFSPMVFGGGPNSSARQIYLTFPADSTFREEDVSSYFSMYGPVQDVRIPYQPKRMFGFVTFVYPETVKLILAKGNPHFVCDSRVLVKPYKEMGKVRDKKQHQHLERVDYGACLSPSGFGPRMLLGTQEMMLRRKLEHDAELQHAIERRMMNLQLMDLNNNHNRHFLPNSPSGVPILPPRQSQFLINHTVVNQEEDSEVIAEFDGGGQEAVTSPTVAIHEKPLLGGTESSTNNNGDDGNKPLQHANGDNFDLPKSLEDILPDNLFASPTISERYSGLSQITNNAPLLHNSSPLTKASLRSCYIQPPRFTSGQEAIEM